jgi:hypothetical protein
MQGDNFVPGAGIAYCESLLSGCRNLADAENKAQGLFLAIDRRMA